MQSSRTVGSSVKSSAAPRLYCGLQCSCSCYLVTVTLLRDGSQNDASRRLWASHQFAVLQSRVRRSTRSFPSRGLTCARWWRTPQIPNKWERLAIWMFVGVFCLVIWGGLCSFYHAYDRLRIGCIKRVVGTCRNVLLQDFPGLNGESWFWPGEHSSISCNHKTIKLRSDRVLSKPIRASVIERPLIFQPMFCFANFSQLVFWNTSIVKHCRTRGQRSCWSQRARLCLCLANSNVWLLCTFLRLEFTSACHRYIIGFESSVFSVLSGTHGVVRTHWHLSTQWHGLWYPCGQIGRHCPKCCQCCYSRRVGPHQFGQYVFIWLHVPF